MSMRRGLRRVWVVLSVVYILGASTAAGMYFLKLNRMEAHIAEAIAEQQRARPNDAHFGGPRFSSEMKPADFQEERRLAMIISPFAIFVPPIALYLIVSGLIWAADGFKDDPPGAPHELR